MSGLTETGFQKKTLLEIKSEIEVDFQNTFGIFINLLPGSVFSLLIGIFAERESSLWDIMEEVYNAMYPDTASGVNLDNAVAFNGLTRLGAEASRILTQLLFGTVGSIIAPGTTFSVDGNSIVKFSTDSPVTLEAGQNAIKRIAFSDVPDAGNFTLTFRGQVTDPILYTANAAAVQAALLALSSIVGVTVTGSYAAGFDVEFNGDDGLQPQEDLISASFLTFSLDPVDTTDSETQPGIAQGIATLTATVVGPVNAPLRTLTVIDTPVAGLTRTTNASATVVGRDIETDAALRVRRDNTLTIAGNATLEAIRSKLLNLPGVSSVGMFENDTDTTDGGGRPPKSYEAVVGGGVDQLIADTIWASKPAGIKTWGTEMLTVVDSQGVNRLIRFSRPGGVDIYVSLDITKDATFPINGAALVQDAIVNWGNAIGVGSDVIVYPRLIAALNPIPGILDIVVRIDIAPVSTTPGAPAVDDNIVIAPEDVAQFTQGRTGVNIL